MNKPVRTLCMGFALMCSGCGTALNLVYGEDMGLTFGGIPGPGAYGGVRTDYHALEGRLGGRDQTPLQMLVATALSVDLPLSFIGDTITLPLAIIIMEQKLKNCPPRGILEADDPPEKPTKSSSEPPTLEQKAPAVEPGPGGR